MNNKNLLIAGSLIGAGVVLIIGFFIIIPGIAEILEDKSLTYFDNSTPEATAISIARLNIGTGGFRGDPIKSVKLTSDGKYWIVETYNSAYKDQVVVMTIDAKTLMSKVEDKEWKSLDELKATYIADIQSDGSVDGKPQKVTMNGKEIWKVKEYDYEDGYLDPQVEYVYVDVATGKSKNTWKEFNKAAGTDGWLTLKQVDDVIVKMGIGPNPFRNALRNLYPE